VRDYTSFSPEFSEICDCNCFSGDITLQVPVELTACNLDLCGTEVTVDNRLAKSTLQRVETIGGVSVTGKLRCLMYHSISASFVTSRHGGCRRIRNSLTSAASGNLHLLAGQRHLSIRSPRQSCREINPSKSWWIPCVIALDRFDNTCRGWWFVITCSADWWLWLESLTGRLMHMVNVECYKKSSVDISARGYYLQWYQLVCYLNRQLVHCIIVFDGASFVSWCLVRDGNVY
jgi:hypothetical protein